MSPKTTEQSYREIIAECKSVFLKKSRDYGTSWTILRLTSLTDQIFIKAKRIRNIETTNENLIGDSVEGEYDAIINYCLMAMMKLGEHISDTEPISIEDLEQYYDKYVAETYELMLQKNADYGEVWRDMRTSSMTDLILSKLLRIKQIEDNGGKTEISEGVFSNYQDILNYSVFARIKLKEENG